MTYYIYKITCSVNGKSYIGVSNNPKRRWIDHRSRAKARSMCPIHCAIRKYGSQAFIMEILYSSEDKENIFNVIEPYFIKEEHTLVKNGYNLTEGGEGLRASYIRKPHSEETKKKMRLAQFGIPKSEEHKAHIKAAKSTPEAKERMRLLMIGNRRGVGYHYSDVRRKSN